MVSILLKADLKVGLYGAGLNKECVEGRTKKKAGSRETAGPNLNANRAARTRKRERR
jgi:hypothetical protein